MIVSDFLEWQDSGYYIGPNETTEKLAFYYAVTSIAYYKHYVSLIPDGIYDLLCKHLLLRHGLPLWLDKESLAAGTGYAVNPPLAAHRAATELIENTNWMMFDE